jgi:transcriptional antiterminator Rof (Rho-off)
MTRNWHKVTTNWHQMTASGCYFQGRAATAATRQKAEALVLEMSARNEALGQALRASKEVLTVCQLCHSQGR